MFYFQHFFLSKSVVLLDDIHNLRGLAQKRFFFFFFARMNAPHWAHLYFANSVICDGIFDARRAGFFS